jgi:ABC-type multidrug transport system permease subunit
MVEVDPVLVALIVLMLLFVLGVYFMLRRTLLAFTEGMREGQNKR